MRIGAVCFLGGLLGACAATVYEPEPVDHPLPLPEDAFDVVLDVLRDEYRRIAVSDRQGFRLQTGWLRFQRGGTPGQRRATVFREADGRLRVLVEAKYLRIGGSGMPETVGPVGDRPAEERLAGRLERILR